MKRLTLITIMTILFPLWALDAQDINPRIITSDNVDSVILLSSLSIRPGPGGFLFNVMFNPHGKSLATSDLDGNTIEIWDLSTGSHIGSLVGHTANIRKFIFSSDGSLLASLGTDNTVRLWNITTLEQITVLRGNRDYITDVTFNSDGTLIAYVNASDWPKSQTDNISIWNIETQEEIFNLDQPQVYQIAFNPNGNQLVATGIDGIVGLWDLQDVDRPVFSQIPVGNPVSIGKAIYSSDGSKVALYERGNHVWLWDNELNIYKTIVGNYVSINFPPKPFTNIVAYENENGVVQLLDMSDGNDLASWNGRSLIGGEFETLSLDETVLISIGVAENNQNVVYVWDTKSGIELRTLNHSSALGAIFSPDGQYIATWSAKGTIQIWGLPES